MPAIHDQESSVEDRQNLSLIYIVTPNASRPYHCTLAWKESQYRGPSNGSNRHRAGESGLRIRTQPDALQHGAAWGPTCRQTRLQGPT